MPRADIIEYAVRDVRYSAKGMQIARRGVYCFFAHAAAVSRRRRNVDEIFGLV